MLNYLYDVKIYGHGAWPRAPPARSSAVDLAGSHEQLVVLVGPVGRLVVVRRGRHVLAARRRRGLGDGRQTVPDFLQDEPHPPVEGHHVRFPQDGRQRVLGHRFPQQFAELLAVVKTENRNHGKIRH